MLNTIELAKLNDVYSSPKKLVAFVEQMVRDKAFAASRPNTHAYVSSLYTWKTTRGPWTDKQLVALRKNIEQQISFFVSSASEEQVALMNDMSSVDEREEVVEEVDDLPF